MAEPGSDELAALRSPGFDGLVFGAVARRLGTGSIDERIRLARYEQFAGREAEADTRLRELLRAHTAAAQPDLSTTAALGSALSQQRLGAAFEPAFEIAPIDWASEEPPTALDTVGIRERVAIAFGRTVSDGREPPDGWPDDFIPGDWAEQERLVAEAARGFHQQLLASEREGLERLLDGLDLAVWVPMLLLMHGDHRGVLGIVEATRAVCARSAIRVLDYFLDYLEGVAQVGLLDLDAAAAPLERAIDGFSRAADRRWWMLAKALQTFVATLTHTDLPDDTEELERALLEGEWRRGRRSLGHSTLMLLAVALASNGDLEGARRIAIADGGLDELTVPATDRIFLLEIMLYAALADGNTVLADRVLYLADHMMASPLVVSVRSRMLTAMEAMHNGSPPPPPAPKDDPPLEEFRTRWLILAQTVAHGSREQAWNALADFDAFAHRARTVARRKHAIRLFQARVTSDELLTMPAKLLEVVTLAAAGLTNREIAERLFLGVRTVESYLREALRLLGIRRRSELAGVWLAMRLAPSSNPEQKHRAHRLVDLPLRQAQVGALIAAGATNAEIADALRVTEKTIDKHIASLKARIGARTRTEIANAFA